MSISIITPHHNDFKGIKQTHDSLIKQDSEQWEWIIVDDFSDDPIKESLIEYLKNYPCKNIKLVFNDIKTNASVCRNIGVDHASYNHLVFLDSDDMIAEDFISNRAIEVQDFAVFKNFNLIDEKGNNKPAPTKDSNYLNHFLQAKFIWQTSAILWNKGFLIKIGKFNTHLKRLQDIELSIRALFLSNNYRVIDNKVDFFYSVSPINIKKTPINIICESVNYLISHLNNHYALDKEQRGLLTGYYFLCVRYFSRSEDKRDLNHVQNSLKVFYKKNYMSYFGYMRALLFINLYKINLISNDLFLKLNRYFYK
ncbi:glycosyltransferase family 2 protein [Hyunsoonleella aestuarii]|nr:glycosyltransferase family 2 protein [Hyunsoonleella aestuarii]